MLGLIGAIYRQVIKRILFLIDPEVVHTNSTHAGEWLGTNSFAKKFLSSIFVKNNSILKQSIAGITFENPIGLAAGFDFEAKLTQILPSIGFGFETIGTITNSAYEGNPRPMLGRLPKSKSLMVYKGFKNDGAKAVSVKLSKLKYKFPLGISIGRTNSTELKTQEQSVEDIKTAFKVFEAANISNAYYEMNISCPNLFGDITFYPPKNLGELLTMLDSLNLSKPVFVKMPIGESNEDTLKMLEVISQHKIAGVIFGNLQKNRAHPLLDPVEVAKFPKGNFSGKLTFERSNELISLAYKNYKDKLVIIGCGGIFTVEDAYLKIKLGASLVQLITGMIYEGPQLAAEINRKLPELLAIDGYKTLAEAVGTIEYLQDKFAHI